MISTVARITLFTILSIGVLRPTAPHAEAIRLLTLYWPPFIDNARDGQVSGVAPALVEAILTDAGLDTKSELLPWQRVYKTAQIQSNILVYTMVRFPERENLFTWISPLFVSEQGVLVYNRDQPLPQPTTIGELRHLKVCVTTGSSFDVKLRALGFEPGKNLFEFETLFPDDASKGGWYFVHPQCDFKITNWGAVTSLLKQRGFKDPEKYISYYPVPERMLGNDMNAYLAASKNFDPKILAAITHSAEKLLQNGALLSICRAEYHFDEKTCSMLTPKK